MIKAFQPIRSCACVMAMAGFGIAAQATSIPFFYTTTGSPDVFSAAYNTTANSISSGATIGYSQQGADGLLAGPNATLLFGGETSGGVFQIGRTGTPASFGTGTNSSYLLAINQNSPQTVFTFDNAGNLAALPIIGGGIQNGSMHPISGPVTNVSDLVWSGSNTAYYLSGSPGTTGSLGKFNMGSLSTNAPLYTGLNTAQSAVYDPFTGLIDLFGNGQVDTFNPVTGLLGTAVNLPGAVAGGACAGGGDQFDTGALDGAGHALITGCGSLYYIDYSGTGNILSLSDTRQDTELGAKQIAFDSVTTVPEVSPAGLLAFGLGLLAFGKSRFGKNKRA